LHLVPGGTTREDPESRATPTQPKEVPAPNNQATKDPEERQDHIFLVRSARKALMASNDAQSEAIMRSLADLYPAREKETETTTKESTTIPAGSPVLSKVVPSHTAPKKRERKCQLATMSEPT
jgi:hypothetical protein